MTLKTPQQLMHDNLIVKHYAGSHSYGTNTATSDVDFRGIFVADPINVRTPFFPIREVEDTTEEDTKLYELNQYMKLALDCNPNIIETIWTHMSDVVHDTPAYQMLRKHAPDLLSSKVAFTTTGYATAQLKRIKGHNKWLTNPQPVEPPQQCNYVSLVHNFTTDKKFKVDLHDFCDGYRLVPFSGDTYGVYESIHHSTFNSDSGSLNVTFEGDSHQLGTPLFIIKFNKDVYNTTKDMHTNYWTWKNNRNKVRSALEEQYGFDCKHASHLVRLMRIGAEALQTGQIIVKRPDAAELLSIRNGAWTYDQLVKYADDMDKYIREDLYPKTHLRKTPDIHLAAKLIIEIQDMVWTP